VKYAYMSGNTGKYSISAQCEVFGVSRSGYYAWRHRQANPGKRQLFREKLDRLVFDAFHARKGRSGAFELSLDLAERDHPYDRKTVAASMKRQSLVAKAAKKFRATTDSNHDLPVAPNLLDQGFSADAPNQKWVCDITYLWTGEGWMYLAVALDAYSGDTGHMIRWKAASCSAARRPLDRSEATLAFLFKLFARLSSRLSTSSSLIPL
jgi:putative transposase